MPVLGEQVETVQQLKCLILLCLLNTLEQMRTHYWRATTDDDEYYIYAITL
jgi:hypothetical protein